jgi:rubrerythrin
MKILSLLTSLEKIELQMSSLYDWLSDVFEDDAEASGLFFRMAMQERSHANLIRYGKKLVHRAPADFAEVDFDPDEIDRLLAAIGDAIEADPAPTLEQAIGLALALEDSPAETAHRSILIHSNPEVAGVIRSLAAADEEHAEGLRTFAEKRGLNLDRSSKAS